MPENGPKCYAVRRVNPYDGVLQILEVEGGRAYSQDGRVWQVQVVAERPSHTWRSTNAIAPDAQYFNFGLWDAAGGMQRIPANPLLDIGVMTAEAERVIEALKPIEARLPFALADCYECWATDQDGNPLALLATAESRDLIERIRVRDWQASRPGDHHFVARSASDRGSTACDPREPRLRAESIERCVRDHTRHRRWFGRLADGFGEPMAKTPTSPGLPPEAFPPLGLRRSWNEPAIQALVDDYVAWLAPRLLLLQDLPDDVRAALEPLACRQAIDLDEHHRLLPQIIDSALVEAAQVEARLRRADLNRTRTQDRKS